MSDKSTIVNMTKGKKYDINGRILQRMFTSYIRLIEKEKEHFYQGPIEITIVPGSGTVLRQLQGGTLELRKLKMNSRYY